MSPFDAAQRVPTAKLDLYIRRNFLSAEECAAIVAMIDARRRPSTIADDNGDPLFRTSETCDMAPDDPLTREIDRRIADFLGLGVIVGEPMQGQRYAPGQEFKLHTDYFEPDGPDYMTHCAVAGQRTWTAMIYLNAPEAGGATRFKMIDKIIQPEAGKMLCWNNQLASGEPNGATLHQGMKVRKGVKYVITKWFRERPLAG